MSYGTADDLIKLMGGKITVAEVALISKAYRFAEEAHKDHKRFSGEPYFTHLYETAKGLAELGMGAKTVAAGLLHDSIEDVGVSPALVEKEFGKEILFLVEGVTKLGKVRYQGTDRHVESLRKFFVAMSKDLRVIIIRLVDRMHNINTLQHVRKEKQLRIAKETLEIYAPLAFRLGIRKVARELADLAFPYVHPKEYAEVRKLLKQTHQKSEKQLDHLHKSVKKALAKNGLTKVRSFYRLKNLYSLYKKLLVKDWQVDEVYDIAALRIIVKSVGDCYQALGVVHSLWRPLPGRIKDYIAFPKPNGYQGIHTTIFTGDGSIIEIQIRTEEMHQEAEYGIASYFHYKERLSTRKEKGMANWVDRFASAFRSHNLEEQAIPSWIDELAESQSHAVEHSEFMQNLTMDFFEDRVFVFTPKGDVVDLPIHSSPLDFAYAIHSDIGDHTAGAKVNGKLVTLDTNLQNGDIVEILTSQHSKPSAKWLDFTKTTLARKHIKNVLDTMKDAHKGN